MPSKAATIATSLVGVLALGLSACTSGSAGDSSAATAAPAGGLNLADVCPATVVVQTDWNPEAEHGHLYELVGPNPTIDTTKKAVTGDLMAAGKPTGVKIEVRAGGPAIAHQLVATTMYTDKDIMLGYVTTDVGMRNSGKFPMKAVFAEAEKSPMMIFWDPATYPEATDLKGLGKAMADTGGVVRYPLNATYMEYLTSAGILPEQVIDSSYKGDPAPFVAAKGKDAQQGFATSEPYIYQNEIAAWGKPVAYQLIHDTGYPIYPQAMSIRSGEEDSYRDCLKKLVPVLQQGTVDYMTDAQSTNELILQLVKEYNNGWVYTQGVADFAVEQMTALGVMANGPSGYVGEMTAERMQRIIDIETPIFTEQNADIKPGLVPADMFTNEYMDKSIKL